MIVEKSAVLHPATETSKKTVLKATSRDSTNKSTEKTLDIKITEVRSPSPIPEDPAGEEDSKQSTSSQEKKIEEEDKREKEDVTERQIAKREDATEREPKLEEQQKEEAVKIDDQQSGSNTEGNNGDDVVAGKTPPSNEEKCEEKHTDTAKEEKSKESAVLIAETKLQGKSRATGRVIGGWI